MVSEGNDDSERGEVILVGTAHISNKSVNQVEKTIEREHPDVVAVELDDRRYESIKKLSKRRDIRYGADMLTAIEEAEKRGIPVALVDRDIRVTIKRFWSKMTTWEKVKFIGALVAGLAGFGKFSYRDVDVDEVMEDEVVQAMIDEFRDFSPKGAQVIIDERDAYMASRLVQLRSEGKRVVAVVGAGHKEGIEEHLKNPSQIPKVPDSISTGHPDESEVTLKEAGDGASKKERGEKAEREERKVRERLSGLSFASGQEFFVDVLESDDSVFVRVDLPGFDTDEISLRFFDGELRIRSERNQRHELEEEGYRPVRTGRSEEADLEISLPSEIKSSLSPDEAEATYENGVLEVTLPKEDEEGVDIEVSASQE